MCADKKIFPGKIKSTFFWNSNIGNIVELRRTSDPKVVSQDLWLTLHLVLGRLTSCISEIVTMLKDPRGAVPPELWIGFQQEEVGVLPSRVVDLIKALSASQLPSFQELLKVFCGGTLRQTCSFCKKRMTVAAVFGEVAGRYVGTPTVSIIV